MKIFFSFFHFLFLTVCFASDSFHKNNLGGDVVIQTPNIQDDSFILLLSEPLSSDSIEDVSFGDFVSNYIGGPVVNAEISRKEFPKIRCFEKNQANLLISVDGIGKGSISANDIPHLMKKSTKQVALSKSSYPQDSVSTVATMLSGHTSSVHGIMGKSWYNEDKGFIEAYRAKALCKVETLSDMMNEVYGGKSLIFSFSGDFQFASAFGIHQFSKTQDPSSNSFGFFWNSRKQRFQSIYNPDERSTLTMEKKDVLSSFKNRVSSSDIMSIEGNDLSIDLKEQVVRLKLNQKEIFAFIAELDFIFTMIEEFENGKLLHPFVLDNYPDLYSIAISSIKGIAEKYGQDSSEVKAALFILDTYLNQVIEKFETVYENKISTEIVFLAPPAFRELQGNKDLKKKVYSSLKKYINDKTVFESTFPVIHLTKPLEDAGESLRKELKQDNLKVHTFNRIKEASEPNYSDAARYQIIIWTSVILVLAVFASVWATYTMDIGADSLIYRDRKSVV